MWKKFSIYALVLCIPVISSAEPVINDISLPPVSFSRVTDSDILSSIGLDPVGGAWCYDDEANAILITAPARERAKCELKLMYEAEKLKVKHKYAVDKLKLRIETILEQHNKINLIKDEEMERLTAAALKRPNDYTVWWATGGFLTGAATVLGIFFLVK